jgi:hypothetical protein
MTCEPLTKSSPRGSKTKNPDKLQTSAKEIVASLEGVDTDLIQISRLIPKETRLVAQFFDYLQTLRPQLQDSVLVSASAFPVEIGEVAQAQVDSEGRLRLAFADGRWVFLDLREDRNRDLLMVVIEAVMPQFRDLTATGQIVSELSLQPQILEPVPTPEVPMPLCAVPELAPVEMPVEPLEPVLPEVPQDVPPAPELPEAPPELTAPAQDPVKIAAITTETLEYLEMLGNEIFEHAPVSKYFDDWMVNLRQVILSFESNEAIGADETFTAQYNQIFGDIEDELAKRQATEADIEVSARTLVENRYLLNKIDEGYVAQTKELVVRGKSAIDYLTRNVAQLEAELAEVAQIKTSYRHPLQKMAKDQKMSELTQKLNAAKKRLALAVGTSSVDHGKAGDLDSEYAAQTQELAEKRKSAIGILTQEVKGLEEELLQVERTKTFNTIKKAQQRFETTQKLLAAKKRLELAEQNSNAEQERLKAEYEKKKQAALGKVQTLEQDIATKTVDNSAEVRKQATLALADAVKVLVARKTANQSSA